VFRPGRPFSFALAQETRGRPFLGVRRPKVCRRLHDGIDRLLVSEVTKAIAL
jgi:hypothetical protein